jgi:hypothetical protein
MVCHLLTLLNPTRSPENFRAFFVRGLHATGFASYTTASLPCMIQTWQDHHQNGWHYLRTYATAWNPHCCQVLQSSRTPWTGRLSKKSRRQHGLRNSMHALPTCGECRPEGWQAVAIS